MGDEREKGEWAQTAEEGIVPDELGTSDDTDAAVLGETTGSDEPATESGIDPSAGDNADALTDGGPKPPEGEEPDLRDAASGPREVDR